MNPTSTKLPATVPGDASLIRPLFSAGLLLQDDDLTQVVDYMRDMTRLLFRTMLGCGVMCGFKVTANIVCNDNLRIAVEKGVALDCHGDLIELPSLETIQYAPPCGEDLPKKVWVVICHKDRDCGPRDVLCSAQEGDVAPVYTRKREGYEIKVIAGEAGGTQPPGCCGCDRKQPSKTMASGSSDTSDTGPAKETCCDYIASPKDKCYEKHYQGKCVCDCVCHCIILAEVELPDKPYSDGDLPVDHSVRRFVRPVLMRDPLVPHKEASVASPPAADSPLAENAPTPPAPASRTSRTHR